MFKKILPYIALITFVIIVLAPFASSSPDGLEWVAEHKEFISKAEERVLWQASPLPDYAIPGIENGFVNTIVSGILGSMLVFGFTILTMKLYRKRNAQR